MTVVELPRAFAPPGIDGALVSWWDADAECTVAIARPADNDALWQEFLAGAQRSYRSHGIAGAIDVDVIHHSGQHDPVSDDARCDRNSGRRDPRHRSARLTW